MFNACTGNATLKDDVGAHAVTLHWKMPTKRVSKFLGGNRKKTRSMLGCSFFLLVAVVMSQSYFEEKAS